MIKLGVFMSHPIQYQANLLRLLSKGSDIQTKVSFFWNFGVADSYDPEFATNLTWDIAILDGYERQFLKNSSVSPSSSFFGCVNPGVVLDIYRNNYDAVLIFGWGLFSNWLVVATCKIFKIPILLIGEAPLSHQAFLSVFKAQIKKFALRLFFRGISAFGYIGQENKKFYLSYGVDGANLFFAPYAVDNGRYIKKNSKTNYS